MIDGNIYSKYAFGHILKERRKECGFRSCSKLAEGLLPAPEQYGDSSKDVYAKEVETLRKKIERWEAGRAEPTISEFKKLCDLLECDPEYLWGICPAPRRETRQVMDITGLNQTAVGFILELKDHYEHLNELNKLLSFGDAFDFLTLFCSGTFFLSDLQEEIIAAENYAKEELEKYPIATPKDLDADNGWWAIPEGMNEASDAVRLWRFEIANYFSKFIDSLYKIERYEASVEAIRKTYRKERKGSHEIDVVSYGDIHHL